MTASEADTRKVSARLGGDKGARSAGGPHPVNDDGLCLWSGQQVLAEGRDRILNVAEPEAARAITALACPSASPSARIKADA
ncbi:hypothetical protein [Microvirga tunisiensis]|uniref:Uncharacterized protein n=1 Tax=Microvirga tunisiensis TaxID=2108360 RepID=A0A5N7MG80_9HYPH|nr:hypothetical protein [Microvirga tunisiensis]MPR06196.1 hypothetical protein [Microvirga tunisiensis]MPR26061.1 hypothetical protein [Microvirga tunisiensis]